MIRSGHSVSDAWVVYTAYLSPTSCHVPLHYTINHQPPRFRFPPTTSFIVCVIYDVVVVQAGGGVGRMVHLLSLWPPPTITSHGTHHHTIQAVSALSQAQPPALCLPHPLKTILSCLCPLVPRKLCYSPHPRTVCYPVSPSPWSLGLSVCSPLFSVMGYGSSQSAVKPPTHKARLLAQNKSASNSE